MKELRRKKFLSKKYLKKHYEDAYSTIEKFKKFLQNELKLGIKSNKNLDKLFYKYSDQFEELLSYYRSSRPEIFEIIEEVLKENNRNISQKKYYKSLILKYGKLRLDLKKTWIAAEKNQKY